MEGTWQERLAALAERKERFTYDLRANCLVYEGVVAAYRATQQSDHFLDLALVIAHALEHDGIVGAWRDPKDGKRYYDSCRLFTDEASALAFARAQHQRSVYNLNRELEREVPGGIAAA